MKKTHIIGGIAAIVVVALIALILVWYTQKGHTGDTTADTDNDTTEEIQCDMIDGELVDYEAQGMLTLGDYTDLTVTVTPTDTEVYESILSDAEDAEVDVTNADRVMKGDWVSIDYVGYVDGVQSDDLDEVSVVTCVGSGKLFNQTFERNLMGQKVGEDCEFDVTFSDSYEDDTVAGSEVTFSVTVNAKFNDDYADAMSDGKYPTVEEYFAHQKKKDKKDNVESAGDTLWDDYVEGCKVIEYPSGAKKQAYKDLKRSYTGFAEASGLSYSEFISSLGYSKSDLQSMANENVRDRMIAQSISVKEGLTLSDEQYLQYLIAYLEPEDDDDQSVEALEESYMEQESSFPRDDMLIYLVKEYLGEHATVK